jgi:hypothetical protein
LVFGLGVITSFDPGQAVSTDAILKKVVGRNGEIAAELKRGAEAKPPDWLCEGKGSKGSPRTYWRAPDAK